MEYLDNCQPGNIITTTATTKVLTSQSELPTAIHSYLELHQDLDLDLDLGQINELSTRDISRLCLLLSWPDCLSVVNILQLNY